MSHRRFLLACALLLARFPSMSAAVSAAPSSVVKYSTPTPAYPRAAKTARIEGVGVVEVAYDAAGKPLRPKMVKSTGSLILDKNTVLSAERYWHSSGGTPTTRRTEVDYRLPPLAKGAEPTPSALPPNHKAFFCPHPNYPGTARQERTSGSLVLRVTFGANGGFVQTQIILSSGSDLLDGYTADFVRLHWKCYNPATTVHTTTIVYILH